MVFKVKVNKYKKLECLELEFNKRMNVISGSNGTCKTTLLHIISNSYRAIEKSLGDDYNQAMQAVKQSNVLINPKIEKLVRDARNYSDPSGGNKGSLYEIDYFDGKKLSFRKHNGRSTPEGRNSIKPKYENDSEDRIPYKNIIYLGLTRLFPVGECLDSELVNSKMTLPDEYLYLLKEEYRKLTHLNVENIRTKNFGGFKSGADFESSTDGVDSNTISSGEDNIFLIIKALVSLAYFSDNEKSTSNVNSILLIDEFDATLHPSLQESLYDLIRKYSYKYKIQVVITTHSLSLLEYVCELKDNLIYLINNITYVSEIKNPTIVDIKMHLRSLSRSELYSSKKIPIFTEDDEARLFLNEIFEYYSKRHVSFSVVRNFFHLVPCRVGSENLLTIFGDEYLLETTIKSICILDGDKTNVNSKDFRALNRCITKLPGDLSPEFMFLDFVEDLFENDTRDFWNDGELRHRGYGKLKYADDIRPDILKIEEEKRRIKAVKGTSKGVGRKESKEVFKKHVEFFTLVMRYWMSTEQGRVELETFYGNLRVLFYKVCPANGISKNEWKE